MFGNSTKDAVQTGLDAIEKLSAAAADRMDELELQEKSEAAIGAGRGFLRTPAGRISLGVIAGAAVVGLAYLLIQRFSGNDETAYPESLDTPESETKVDLSAGLTT